MGKDNIGYCAVVQLPTFDYATKQKISLLCPPIPIQKLLETY